MNEPTGGYASAYPSSRVSGRVSLDTFQPQSIRYAAQPPLAARSCSSADLPSLLHSANGSLPTDLLLSLLLSKSLLALSLYVARHWVLAQGYSVWTLNAIVLGLGAVGLQVWERIGDSSTLAKRREVSRVVGLAESEMAGLRLMPALCPSQDQRSPSYAVIFAAEVLFAFLALSKVSVLRSVMLLALANLESRAEPG